MKNAVHSVANSNRHLDRSSGLNGTFLFIKKVQKRCGLQVKATGSLFAVNAPVLKPLDKTVFCLKNLFFLKSYSVWLILLPLFIGLRSKDGHWWQVKGYCHFKKPADWSVNMEKLGADFFKLWDINQPPYYKIRKSKQRFTPINTPFIYFLQKYTEKIIKRFHLSCLFLFF